MARTKIRWGDTLDDEDALPPTHVRGPDNNGIKITTGARFVFWFGCGWVGGWVCVGGGGVWVGGRCSGYS
jgi:hypothetical protein